MYDFPLRGLFMVERCSELFAEALLFEFLVPGVGVIGEGVDADTSSGHEIAGYLKILGIHEFDQVFHNDVDAVFMEIAVVAEREEIELEALALYHALARDITNVDVSEIGLPCFGAEGCEFRAVECNEILVLGMFVGKSLQHGRVVVVGILYVLIAKQGNSLQFIFYSHNKRRREAVFSVNLVLHKGGKT